MTISGVQDVNARAELRRLDNAIKALDRRLGEIKQNSTVAVQHEDLQGLAYPAGHTGFVSVGRQIIAGTGLTGGGNLSGDVTLSLGTVTAAGRGTLPFSGAGPFISTNYLSVGGVLLSTNAGYNMDRAGSVIGISGVLYCSGFGGTNQNPAFRVLRVGGGSGTVLFSTSVFMNNSGIFKSQATQAAGIDTFVAGDMLAADIQFPNVGNSVIDVIVLVHLQFDS